MDRTCRHGPVWVEFWGRSSVRRGVRCKAKSFGRKLDPAHMGEVGLERKAGIARGVKEIWAGIDLFFRKAT
jgi:hypothetical protein